MRLTTAFALSLGLAAASGAVAETGGAHHRDGHGPRHVVGAFVGVTDPHGEPAETTLGFEYEFRGGRSWGAGAVVERTGEAHHGEGATVAVALVHYHLNDLRLSAGLGRESVDHHGSESLQRIGASYDLDLGPVAIAPTVSLDFVDGERVPVYGLTVLKHF